MFSNLLKLSSAIDAVSSFVGRCASWLGLAAILISAGTAIARKFFNVGSNAWLEAQWYLFSAMFLLCAAVTLLHGEHVKVDLIYARLSRRTQLWVEAVGTVLFLFPFCIITVYLSWPIVLSKIASGEVSNNTGGLAMWPVWALIPAGFTLLGLQGLSELIKRLAILGGAMEDTRGS